MIEKTTATFLTNSPPELVTEFLWLNVYTSSMYTGSTNGSIFRDEYQSDDLNVFSAIVSSWSRIIRVVSL